MICTNFNGYSLAMDKLSPNRRASPIHSSASSGVSIDYKKEEDLSTWSKWGEVVNNWEKFSNDITYLKLLMCEGIPDVFRSLFWQLIAGVHESSQKFDYPDLVSQNSMYERRISLDVSRVFPYSCSSIREELISNITNSTLSSSFATIVDTSCSRENDREKMQQSVLFNVLKAYSVFDPEIGYSQGCGFIISLILMILPEEDSFVTFTYLMVSQRLRELFKPSMYELSLRLFQLESLISTLVSTELAQHFHTKNFRTSNYASNWFLTFFSNTFSQSTSFRIMDMVLLEGILALFQFSLAYLKMIETDLLTLNTRDEITTYLQFTGPGKIDKDPVKFLLISQSIRVDHTTLAKLEQEYLLSKSQELEEEAKYLRLRTENENWLNRIDNSACDYFDQASSCVSDQDSAFCSVDRDPTSIFQSTSNRRNSCYLPVVLSGLANNSSSARTENKFNNSSLPYDVRSEGSSTNSSCEENRALTSQIINLQRQLVEMNHTINLYKERCRLLELENQALELRSQYDTEAIQSELMAAQQREVESTAYMHDIRRQLRDLEMRCNSSTLISSASKVCGPFLKQSFTTNSLSSQDTSDTQNKLNNDDSLSPKKYNSSINTQPSNAVVTRRSNRNSFTRSLRNSTSFIGSAMKMITQTTTSSNSVTNTTANQLRAYQEEITRLKLKNTCLQAELINFRKSVMELESVKTQNQRQLARQDDKMQKLKDELDASICKEQLLQIDLKETQNALLDIETKRKEELYNHRIHQTELSNQLLMCQLNNSTLADNLDQIDICASDTIDGLSDSDDLEDGDLSLTHDPWKTPTNVKDADDLKSKFNLQNSDMVEPLCELRLDLSIISDETILQATDE